MKKNYWFRLDCDFLSDPKIQDIHFALGNDAIVAYLVTVIRLYKSGGTLGVDKYAQIAYEAHTSIEVVKKVVEDYGLFILNGDSFCSARVLEELDAQRGISEIRASAGRLGAQQRLANAQANAKQMLMQKPSKGVSKTQANTITNTITNTEESNIGSSLHSEPCPTKNQSDADNPQIFPKTEEEEEKEEKALTPKQCQQVIDFWNRKVKMTGALFSIVEVLSDARKRKIQTRWREFSRLGHSNDVFRKIVEKACASKFLQGDSKNGWVASFDWIFYNDKNWVKIYEGNYDDKEIKPKSHIDRMEEDMREIHNFFNQDNNGTEQQGFAGYDEQ